MLRQRFCGLLESVNENRFGKDDYKRLAVNLAARNMMTLPEIHAGCIEAALEMDPLRIAYGAQTAAEEGGLGNPDKVHSQLMVNALNSHGTQYGIEPPLAIDLPLLMTAARVLHVAAQIRVIEGWNLPPDNDKERRAERIGIVTLETKKALRSRLVQRLSATMAPSPNPAGQVDSEGRAITVLREMGVADKTIDYCKEQFGLLTEQRPGYIQGVSFIHEGVADDILRGLFRLMHAKRRQYHFDAATFSSVYPYFAAHGNYLDELLGGGVAQGGVEKDHAMREEQKLKTLDPEELENACTGARDFVDRDSKLWEDVLGSTAS